MNRRQSALVGGSAARTLALCGAITAGCFIACKPNFDDLMEGSPEDAGSNGFDEGGGGNGSSSSGAPGLGGTVSHTTPTAGSGVGAATGGAAAVGGSRNTGGSAGSDGRSGAPPVSSGGTNALEGGAAGESGAGGDAGASAGMGGSTFVEPEAVVENVEVAQTWSGQPLDYPLLTHGDRQFVAFYNGNNRKMTIATRSLGGKTWQSVQKEPTVGWDSHQGIRMAVDEEGYLHLVGNMHNSPLVYFRTSSPLDITTFERQTSMVEPEEEKFCTYPEIFHGPEGNLIFQYRNGSSGNATHIFNKYDVQTKTWTRLLGTPLLTGEGVRNAYPVGPIQGPDEYWHLVWVWRVNSSAETNHTVSYARTRDLLSWEKADGTLLELPIKLSTGDIVDPVDTNEGLINNNTKVGFDADNRVVVSYHKYDDAGNTQLYNARFEDGQWVRYQATEWAYRWNFGGGGTLEFEIQVQGVAPAPNGDLIQRYFHKQYGGWGAFLIENETLSAVEEIEPPLPYPRELDVPQSPTPEMFVRWSADTGKGPDPDVYYMLRWESLNSNRDMERPTIPPPTELRVYAFDRRLVEAGWR